MTTPHIINAAQEPRIPTGFPEKDSVKEVEMHQSTLQDYGTHAFEYTMVPSSYAMLAFSTMVKLSTMLLPWILVWQLPLVLAETNSDNVLGEPRHVPRNLFREALELCSTDGMAATGWNKDGFCSHRAFDERSRAICVDIPSFSAEGNEKMDLDAVLGHYDILQGEHPCVQDSKKLCPVENLCVNEHSFAYYVERVGGCENVGRIVCAATSEDALEDYWEEIHMSGFEGVARALNAWKCIQVKCWL
jgi:hypothetical protein